GALISDLAADFAATLATTTADFDLDAVERTLASLRARCEEFAAAAAGAPGQIELSAEARYPHQIWELELPIREPLDVDELRRDFHAVHEQVFAISDPGSEVELVAWRARVRCPVGRSEPGRLAQGSALRRGPGTRRACFDGVGVVDALVVPFQELEPGRPPAPRSSSRPGRPWSSTQGRPPSAPRRAASRSPRSPPVPASRWERP